MPPETSIGWVGNKDAMKHANVAIAAEHDAFGGYLA